MNVILCCGKMSLRDRWFASLSDHYTVYQTGALQELSFLVKNRISFELMILHRPLLDKETMLYIREKIPACKLFILSDRPTDQEGVAFLQFGVAGYANSYISHERLRAAVGVIASGSVWINQSLMQYMIQAVAQKKSAQPMQNGAQTFSATEQSRPFAELTNREYEITQLVGQGASNADIAAQLGIAERTVKSHLSTIFAKTSTNGRLALALLYNTVLNHRS